MHARVCWSLHVTSGFSGYTCNDAFPLAYTITVQCSQAIQGLSPPFNLVPHSVIAYITDSSAGLLGLASYSRANLDVLR